MNMKIKTGLFAILFSFSFLACFSQEAKTNEEVLSSESAGAALIAKCYICHNPRVKKEIDIIAPPMVEVKYIYKMRNPEKNQFVNKISAFVLSPDNVKAVMKGRVMTHGVMPNLSFTEEEVRKIVEFIFENELEPPIWFPEYFKKKYGENWVSQ